MKVFISHALIDKDLAESFKKTISSISLGLIKPWLSSSLDGLKPGDVLWDEVHQNLNSSDKIIALLTPNSFTRPWVLYESGYVAGLKKNNVIPITIGLSKSQLPSPLSAYVIYSGDNANDLSKFFCQILAEVVPEPNQNIIQSQTMEFIDEISSLFIDINTDKQIDENEILSQIEIRLVDKLKASQIFQNKLSDPNVKEISILTYTNEVESGNISHHRLQGDKNIKIFKRSILADLSEQQISNINNVKNKLSIRPWDKFKISYNASRLLEEEFEHTASVKIEQYFYDAPPSKRAYLFDNNEAIIASYENKKDHSENGGSLYRGMNSSKSLWVNRNSILGSHLIDEVKQSIFTLEKISRSWKEERKAIQKLNGWRNITRKPCLNPKVVFLDMDGVLYNSLPHYVSAWQEGFKAIDLLFPEIEVYRQEGKPSKATVEDYLDRIGAKGVSHGNIAEVLKRKDDALNELGSPPIQEGAIEMVKKISDSNLPMYVVTGSSRTGIKEKIYKDFEGLIEMDQVITGNDYKKGKPYPFPFQIASIKSNCCAEESIVIENAPLGIKSAESFGSFCIALNTGILDDSELEQAGARIIFDSCNSLSKNWTNLFSEITRHIKQVHY
ncbi:HAD hydrolase-like protein [Desulfospira joergensenii]|uniref:HAD hydrolase-like protein n=1 Tax=Desulfospira joergensenii TaxID=53329 RepID=UPI0003B5ADD9|nr:HAD hydrolase-like protein [Desulfospira joergensenii]